MTGRYVNRADSPMRTSSDQVDERIAAAMAGGKPADVISLKTTRHKLRAAAYRLPCLPL